MVNPHLPRMSGRAVQRIGVPARRLGATERSAPRIVAHHPRTQARILALAAPAPLHPLAWTAPDQRSTLKFAVGWGAIGTLALLALLAHCAHAVMFLWAQLAG